MNAGLLIIRLIAGLVIAANGEKKLSSSSSREESAAEFDSLGYRPGKLFALLVGLTEALGGLGLAVGLLTPLATTGLVAAMSGATLSHLRNGLWQRKRGYEYTLVLGGVAAGLAFTGPGNYSLDYRLGLGGTGVRWGEPALALALIASVPIEIYRRRLTPADETVGSFSSPRSDSVSERQSGSFPPDAGVQPEAGRRPVAFSTSGDAPARTRE